MLKNKEEIIHEFLMGKEYDNRVKTIDEAMNQEKEDHTN